MTDWIDKPDGPGHWIMIYQHPTDPVVWQMEVRRWGRGMQFRHRDSGWRPLSDWDGPRFLWMRIPAALAASD